MLGVQQSRLNEIVGKDAVAVEYDEIVVVRTMETKPVVDAAGLVTAATRAAHDRVRAARDLFGRLSRVIEHKDRRLFMTLAPKMRQGLRNEVVARQIKQRYGRTPVEMCESWKIALRKKQADPASFRKRQKPKLWN